MAAPNYLTGSMFLRVEVRRFWRMVDKSGGRDACWPWLGGVNADGYGRFRVMRGRTLKEFRAHRIAFALWRRGRVRELVLHTCDNRRCCNRRHLYEGTDADNAADKSARGRSLKGGLNPSRRYPERRPRGEAVKVSKLTESDVRQLRALHELCGPSYMDLAGMFGVTKATVGKVINRQSWRHIQ